MNQMKKGLLIGASGQQGSEYFELLKKTVNWSALVDVNLESLKAKYASTAIPCFSALPDFASNKTFDFALVAVPHNQHLSVCRQLLERNIPVIKEKPLAQNVSELNHYRALLSQTSAPIFTIVQRSFHPLLQLAQRRLQEIGPIYSFQYDYFMPLKSPTSGWRADRSISGGGVVIDMGYHIIDVLNRFFGSPDRIKSSISYCFGQTRASSLEDSAQIVLEYDQLGIHGQLHLERHHYQKKECLEILGEQGAMVITPNSFSMYDRSGQLRDQQTWMGSKAQSLEQMFGYYLDNLDNSDVFLSHFTAHSANVHVVDKIYKDQSHQPATVAAL